MSKIMSNFRKHISVSQKDSQMSLRPIPGVYFHRHGYDPPLCNNNDNI